ncbi:substrate-Binding region of ABC-type glycine betaine transport system protein [Arthrobacter sp. Hiyo8]|nr:substrate-Binding region of ABC-type glycine betaine transport system protein [Arthrobacter sp. Hiyo8]
MWRQPAVQPVHQRPLRGRRLAYGGLGRFPESQVIAEIYAGALNAAGVTATTKPNIGSREIYFKAVQDGSIDLAPDYSGNLLSYLDTNATQVSADDVYKALPGKLPQGLGVLDPAKAEDKDAMVVTKATAEKYQLKSIEDLAKVCGDLTMAAPQPLRPAPTGSLASKPTTTACSRA